MDNANLYRLQQINETEKEFHKVKLKHSAVMNKQHCLFNFCSSCFLVAQFYMFLINVVFL